MRTKPIVFYISGPYRATNANGVLTNISEARVEAMFIIENGACALCPHLNTAFMDGLVPDDNFLQMDLVLLARCDVVYAIGGWRNSRGAKAEVEFAQRLGIPVVYTRLEVLNIILSSSSSSSSSSLLALLRKMYGLLKEREFKFLPDTAALRCPDCGSQVMGDNRLDDQFGHAANCLYAQCVDQARLVLGDLE